MTKFKTIVENYPLGKFESLTRLIVSLRSELNIIVKNNKNGYVRIAEDNGSLFIARTLLGSPPERAKENEQVLTQITYEMAKHKECKIFFKERESLEHEKGKPIEELICSGIRFGNTIISVGGLQACENLAISILFPIYAVEEYYSPNPVDSKYVDEYGLILANIINESEKNSTDSIICKNALKIVEAILKKTKTIWPQKTELKRVGASCTH